MAEWKITYFTDNEFTDDELTTDKIKQHFVHSNSETDAIGHTKRQLGSFWFQAKMIYAEVISLNDKLYVLWKERFPHLSYPKGLSVQEIKEVLGLEPEWGLSREEFLELLATDKNIPSEKTKMPIWGVKFSNNKARRYRMCRYFSYAFSHEEAIKKVKDILGDEVQYIHSVFPVNCIEDKADKWIVKYQDKWGVIDHYHTVASCAEEAIEKTKAILSKDEEFHILIALPERQVTPVKYSWEVKYFDGEKISSHTVYAVCEEEAISKVKRMIGDELPTIRMMMAEGSTLKESLRVIWHEKLPDHPFPENSSFEQIKKELWPWSEEI